MYPFDSAPWTSRWGKMKITDKILFFSFINTIKLAIILLLVIYIIIVLIRFKRITDMNIEQTNNSKNHQ